jgi:ketosteroid isomerase-like protein
MATEYTAAIGRGDREAFLSFFTDSIVIMPPGAPILRGRDAARNFAGPLFDNFNVQESIVYDELHVNGDWATGRFSYTMTLSPKKGGASTAERGKAIAWLRRTPTGPGSFRIGFGTRMRRSSIR